MAKSPVVDLNEFTCSICLELFRNPISLSCAHSYCHHCSAGLKKFKANASSIDSLTNRFPPSSHVHHADEIFHCAICRQSSHGYIVNHSLVSQMKSLETSCINCSNSFDLLHLRTHLETCQPMKISPVDRQKLPLNINLSASQAEALRRAQQEENRSTFSCPFCERTNFSVSHLRQHIKKRHRHENQHRVCPICASMPWGDATLVTSNVYQHIKARHQFDYDTYVDYEMSEEAMMREALKASLIDQ